MNTHRNRLRGWVLPMLLCPAGVWADDLEVRGYEVYYNTASSPYLLDVWTVPDNFINTGLAYDPAGHVLFCSHLEWGMQVECIETLRKADGTRAADPLRVNPHTALVQGLTYDPADSTLWVWGGNVPYEEKFVAHFDRSGAFLGRFLMPGYPGSLAFDPERRLILSKAMNDTWVKFYTRAGIQVDQFHAGYGGEGLARDPFDGSYWVLTEATVYHVRRAGAQYNLLGSYPNPSRYYPPDTLAGYWEDGEAEGIVVDPSDRTLWFSADQHCHGGIPGGNRCWHINPLGTYNQAVLIPQGMIWERGHRDHTVMVGNRLRIEPGCATGSFVTPVVDFEDYLPYADSLFWSGDGQVQMEYRGSTEPPTTAVLENLTLRYYDANQAGEGWGNIVPGAWQPICPAQRFVQVRLTLTTAAADVTERLACNGTAAGGAGIGEVSAVPNPFAARTRLRLPAAMCDVRVEVLDAGGRCVRVVTAGVWDGYDAAGHRAAPGVYFLRGTQSGAVATGRVVLLRP